MKLRKGKEIIWGLLLLGGAALLILSQLGYELTLGQFSWFQIVVLVGCAWFAIMGIIEMKFFNLMVSLALAYVICDKPLGLPEIDAWIVFLAALFAGAGLHKIFRKKNRNGINIQIGDDDRFIHINTDDEEEVEYREVIDEDSPRKSGWDNRSHYGKEVVFANKTIYTGDYEFITGEYVFSGVNLYVEGQKVRAIDTDVVFSNAKMYFDKAGLLNNHAELNVDVVFSSLDLYVPKEWNVVNETETVFGRHVHREEGFKEGAPTLYVKGDCVFGGIHIKRV